MKVKGLTVFLLSIAVLLMAVPAGSAKPADRDRDGIRDRHERYLGTNPNHYTKSRHYVNRVVRYTRSTGRLIFYRAKGRPVYTHVDEESTIYCDDEYYWLDDDSSDDSNNPGDSFDEGSDENFDENEFEGSAPCSDDVVSRGMKIDEAKISYYGGRFYIDMLHLR